MADKRLAGTRILMVIAPAQFRDEELLEPQKIFADAGAEVVVASRQLGEARGMLGARSKPDILIKDARPGDYDAIVVVGGMGSPEHLWDDADLHKLIKDMDQSGKVVSGICLSGAVLARAGVLKEKQATVWPMPESLAALDQGKARYVKQPVVYDGRIITANGPEAAREFAQTIVSELARLSSKV